MTDPSPLWVQLLIAEIESNGLPRTNTPMVFCAVGMSKLATGAVKTIEEVRLRFVKGVKREIRWLP